MHLDHDGVGAHGHRSARQAGHQVAHAGRMGHVHADGQQALLVDDGHGRDVERETRGRLERAQAALAQHHVVVALHGDVVRCRQPLGDGAREAALEQHHLVGVLRDLADVFQQAEVLEVTGAHLQAVHIGMHQLAMLGVHDLRKGFQAVLLAAGLHDLKGFLAKTLEAMRVGTRFVRAAADPGQAKVADALGHFEELLLAFDRARAGVDGYLVGTGAVIRQFRFDSLLAHADGVSFMTFRIVP